MLQPDQLREVIDLSLPDEPQNLDQLLVDCKDSLKYQVKTGRRGSACAMRKNYMFALYSVF